MMDNKDKLSELPKGWVWTRVGELYNIVGGGTPSTKIANYWNGNIPWITSADIYGLKNIIPRKQITEDAIKNSATNLVPERSIIVVTRVGLGKIALTKIPLCFSQDSQALIDNSFFIFPDYSLYYLSTAVQIFKYKHRGTTIAGVTKKQLFELEFVLPPLPEQHRIVAKIEELFTRLDAGTAALKKVKAELKRYRQAVLKYAFEGELTAAWREANKDKIKPASVLLARIKEERRKAVREKYKEILLPDVSDLHELPEGWLWASSSEVCASVRDGTHDTPKYVEVGIPLITSKNLKENGLDFSTAKNISTEDHQKISLRSGVEAGDILFAMIGTIGNPVVVKTGRVFSIKNVALFKKNTPFIFSEYLKYWFEGLVFNKLLEKKKYLKGTTQRFIPLEYLRILPIPLCNYQEQRQIIEEIERRLSVADEVEKVVEQSRRQSERLRQSILKKAFAGKLVLQDPSDEPAEKLLERIKAEKAKHDAEVKGKKASKKKSSTKQGRLK